MKEVLWKKRKSFGEFEITSYGALFFTDEGKKYIVIGDLHLGMEEALRIRGISIPKKQIRNIKKSLNELGKEYGFDTIVILNGDIKHEFSELTYAEQKDINDVISFLYERFKDVIIIKGNHDTFIINILKNKGISLQDYYETKKFHVEHGHKLEVQNKDKHLILSHEHPAITLRDDVGGYIKLECFLIYKDKKRYVVVLPAFSSYSQGLDILRIEDSEITNPYIQKIGLKNFEVYGINKDDHEIFYFGRVEKLKNIY